MYKGKGIYNMKSWVKEKLNIINELYPEERITKSKERWQRMWNGEKPLDRYPFLFKPVSFDYYNDVFSYEEGLKKYLDEFIYRGFVGDDFIPAFFPGCRQGTIPGMFGAKEIILGKDYSCERLVHKPEDIDCLPEPSIKEGTPAWEWLEMERYYLEECEGKIPIHVCDMQGPMDVCGQLWGYENLFICAYEDEERYRRLMDKATQAYIMLWEEQKNLLGENFVGTHLYGWDWVPKDNGATLSADSMVMISDSFFDEFYSEYLEEIASRFGNLTIHSCGNFKQIVPVLAEADYVKAVNASQMSVKELLDAGWDTRKVIINQESIADADELFKLAWEKNLNLNICFDGLWPCDKDGAMILPEEWTQEQRREIKEKAGRVLEAAKCK